MRKDVKIKEINQNKKKLIRLIAKTKSIWSYNLNN